MPTYVFGPFRMDLSRRMLLAGGQMVELQARTFELLAFLIAAHGRVVTRDEIVAAVWQGQVVAENNLTVQMSLLRRALAAHEAAPLIVTAAGRGYRFVGDVGLEAAPDPVPEPGPPIAASAPPHRPHPLGRLAQPGRRQAALAIALAAICMALGLAAARIGRAGHAVFLADVKVEAVPDTVMIAPNGYCHVDYRFTVTQPIELQLQSEDVRFYLLSGEPVSQASIRGRIYHGSFPIRGPGVGTYHNNLWLPPAVVAAVQAGGAHEVYLRHLFHLADPAGREVAILATTRIGIGTPGMACVAEP